MVLDLNISEVIVSLHLEFISHASLLLLFLFEESFIFLLLSILLFFCDTFLLNPVYLFQVLLDLGFLFIFLTLYLILTLLNYVGCLRGRCLANFAEGGTIWVHEGAHHACVADYLYRGLWRGISLRVLLQFFFLQSHDDVNGCLWALVFDLNKAFLAEL